MHRQIVSGALRAVVALGLLAAGAGAAVAQNAGAASGPVARGAPDLSQQVPPARPPSAPITAPNPGGACPFGGQGLTVTLTKVTVEGATVVTPTEVDAAVASLLGQKRDLAVVCEARDRVAALFARKGYRLTRVDLPPQRIESGVLKLTATEGYVASLDTGGLTPLGPSAALARAYFAGLTKERPTRWDDLERAVLLARDIPGAEVSVRVHAGAPGAVEVSASAPERRRFDLSLGLQHLGADETGATSVYGRLDANSFTRFGDRTSVVLFSSTNGDQKVVEGIESFNIGAHGLRAQAEVDYAKSTPGGALAPLQLDGDFLDASARLDYPVIRAQALNLVVGARFDYINQTNDIGILRGVTAGTPVLFNDRLRLLSADFDLRWRPENLQQLDAEVSGSVVQGLSGIGASQKGDPTLSRAQGDPQATILRLDGSVRITGGRQVFARIGGPWLEFRGSSQWANHPLTAYEEFQIGNYTIGRGFSPGAASGDRAIGGQIEAGWRFAYSLDGTTARQRRLWVEPYGFVDAAHLWNLDIGGYSTDIASAGGGVRALLPWSVQIDVAYADPLTRAFPGAPASKGRLLLTLTRVFSFR
jgi:hemolysin activation/secretion protein